MYDPLVSPQIDHNQPYPDSYWADSLEQVPQQPSLREDIITDTAIIGAGYAGLSCAYHLAKDYDNAPIVLEANNPGWGCSGRNAGFVLPLSGRLGYAALAKKFGLQTAKHIHQEFLNGVALVEQLIEQSNMNVDRQPNGYLKIAHRPKYFDQLRTQADYMAEHFGYNVTPLSKDELCEKYVDHHQAHGALLYQEGYGIHPFKLCQAYLKLALAQGAQVYGNSPVQSWSKEGAYHLLQTPLGRVKAKKVVCCSNGYTPRGLHASIDKSTLPVLTSVIVTSPLSDEQIQASRFFTNQVMMDTRQLKYYYRKLPDNRILFGGRGAISGKEAQSPVYHDRLLQGLKTAFPALHELRADYRWSGWISVSLDDIPHIHQYDDSVFYSAGYCGAGLSFSALAGKRLAQKVAGDTNQHNIPMLTKPLPRFPFSPFRRVGQRMFYEFGRIRDNWF